MQTDLIAIPQEILKLHNDLVTGMDIMFVNVLPFFTTISSKIKFTTVEFIPNLKISHLFECYSQVVALYNSRGFKIKHLLGDRQFSPMKPLLMEKFKIHFNNPSANEHVSEIECQIRVIKERVRALLSTLHGKRQFQN